MLARSSSLGSTHTALSPKASSWPSDPSYPGMLAIPMLDTVVTPSRSPTIICPARITSPVVWAKPAKVASILPSASRIKAV